MNIEDLKRKVRALYRHAKGTTNSMEAMAFADKAKELLQAYGDELPDDYEPTSGEEQRHSKRNNSYGLQGETKFDTKKKDQVYSMLLSVTATFYGCDYSVNKESVNEMCIYGSEGARETTILMYKYFLKACQEAGRKWHEDKPFFPVKEATLWIIHGFSLRLHKINGGEIIDRGVTTRAVSRELVKSKEHLPSTKFFLYAIANHWEMTRAEAISLTPQLSKPKTKAVRGKKKPIGRPKKALR